MIPKFRAWDTMHKEWAVPFFIYSEGGIYTPDYSFLKNKRHESTNVYPISKEERFILMQSTGLFDKNGVEVFIGDIVRCSQGCPHEVIFIKEFGGMFVGGMPTIYLSDMSEGYAWTGDEEVIGDIYENPELVEVKND